MFRVVQNSTTADAADINDNFYYIAQGTIFPFGGDDLDYTTSSNLGSATYRWKTLYCNTMVAASFNPDISIRYIATTILSGDSSRIEVSGLSGEKNINIEYFINTQVTGSSVYLIFNGQSASGYYGYVSTRSNSSTSHAASISNSFGAILLFTNYLQTSSAFLSFGIIKANFSQDFNANKPKISCFGTHESGGDYIGYKTFTYGVCNTTTSLTSLTIYSTGGDMKSGSFVTVWAV